MNGERERVASAMHEIYEAWLAGRLQDLAKMVHDEMNRVADARASAIGITR